MIDEIWCTTRFSPGTYLILYTQDLERIARENGFEIHMYADDTQLYITFEREQSGKTVPLLEKCLKDTKEWMQINFLKLNEDKTTSGYPTHKDTKCY